MERPVLLNVNLLPPPNSFRPAKTWGAVMLIMLLLGTVSAGVFIAQKQEINKQESENIRLQASLTNYKNAMVSFAAMQIREQKIAAKGERITAIEEKRLSYSALLNEIDQAGLAPLTIVAVEVKGPRTVVSGFSPDHSTVSRMLETITGDSIFKDVISLSSELNEETNEVNFILEIEWEAG